MASCFVRLSFGNTRRHGYGRRHFACALAVLSGYPAKNHSGDKPVQLSAHVRRRAVRTRKKQIASSAKRGVAGVSRLPRSVGRSLCRPFRSQRHVAHMLCAVSDSRRHMADNGCGAVCRQTAPSAHGGVFLRALSESHISPSAEKTAGQSVRKGVNLLCRRLTIRRL